MNQEPTEPLLLMSAPFAARNERIHSARYCWENSARGGEFVIIQRTSAGLGCFNLRGTDCPVPPGHALVAIVPEESRYYYPPGATEPWHFTWLNFYGRLAVKLCADLRARFGPVLPLAEHSAAGVAFGGLVSRGVKRLPPDFHDSSLAVYSFLLHWARELQEPGHGKPDPVELVSRLCRARFREPLGTKELAAEVGLSREHLTRLFTERMGTSPGRYLRGLRVEAAREMLRDPAVPLRETALRCGFPSVRALKRALEGGSAEE
jgi:AraC-like DNA-binding protein